MNSFDVAVSAIILLLGLKGLLNGFFKEVFGLIGIVGGVFVASRLGGVIGKFLSDFFFHFESSTSVNLVGFIFAMAIFWLLMVSLGTVFKKLTSLSGLGSLDRILGFAIGSGKFFFIISVIVYALFSVNAIRTNFEDKLSDSFFYHPMFAAGSFILHLETDNVPALLDDANATETNISRKDR